MWRDKITFPSYGAYLKFMCFWSRGYGIGWERLCFSMYINFLSPVNILPTQTFTTVICLTYCFYII